MSFEVLLAVLLGAAPRASWNALVNSGPDLFVLKEKSSPLRYVPTAVVAAGAVATKVF